MDLIISHSHMFTIVYHIFIAAMVNGGNDAISHFLIFCVDIFTLGNPQRVH
jgi:hypothetical protein